MESESHNHRLEALHNYEALLEQALVDNEITGEEYVEALNKFIEWVESPRIYLLPEDNIEPPYPDIGY